MWRLFVGATLLYHVSLSIEPPLQVFMLGAAFVGVVAIVAVIHQALAAWWAPACCVVGSMVLVAPWAPTCGVVGFTRRWIALWAPALWPERSCSIVNARWWRRRMSLPLLSNVCTPSPLFLLVLGYISAITLIPVFSFPLWQDRVNPQDVGKVGQYFEARPSSLCPPLCPQRKCWWGIYRN